MFSKNAIATLTLLGLSALGCGKSEPAAPTPVERAAETTKPAEPQPTPPPAAAAVEDPQAIFSARCVMCHGATGQGDGAAAAAMNPKPRNYHDADWQKTVTDEQIKKAIVGGGAAVGKSPLMPGQPDLKPETVDGLVKIIRGFAKG